MHQPPKDNIMPVRILIRDSEEPYGIKSLLSDFIEFGILSKTSYAGYKNGLSGNLRIFAAFQTSSLLALATCPFLIYLISQSQSNTGTILGTFLTFYIGSIAAIFVSERSSLYKRWEYLASIYNKLIVLADDKPTEYPKRKILRVALAIDILEMEMWAHKSYKEIFRTVLEEAIRDWAHTPSAKWINDHLEDLVPIAVRV